MNGGAPCSRRVRAPTAQIGARECGGRGLGKDVEIDRAVIVEGARRKLPDQPATMDARQVREDASGDRGPEQSQAEQIGRLVPSRTRS